MGGGVNKPAVPHLPLSQLLAISVYWFGINALWGGYEIFGQWKVQDLVGIETRGQTIGIVEFLAALVAIVVQPTIGSISDYTQSRWGRRKPFILIGGLLDVVAIFGIATSQSLLALVAFLLMLSFTSNFAQGPFQGYVPDLVPDRQVNVASALVGLMRLLGVIVGAAIVSTGASTNNYALPLMVIGLIEAALAVLTVLTVREGPTAKPRAGRSWSLIAREAWGTDALRERSFVFMTLTRLMFLAGPSIFVNLSLYYMEGSMALAGPELQLWLTVGTVTIGAGTVIGTITSAWLAQRLGRKTVAWAAAAVAAAGIVLIAVAPEPMLAVPGLLLIGLGSGTYIAVDWALMTSTIPRASSGRYMGLANIANSISGPIGLIVGGLVLDAVTRSAGVDAGPRAATLVGLAFLGAAVLLLIPVKPRVEPPGDEQLATEQARAT
jgi:Na+/melibiose symporter-like transporter